MYQQHMLLKLRKPISEIHTKQVLLDFSLTVEAAPHECVIRTSQPYA